MEEQVLDPRLSAESVESLRRSHEAERNPAVYYYRFLSGLLRGDAGRSVVFGLPVADLVRDRAPVTIHTAGVGLAIGWILSLALAVASALRGGAVVVTSIAVSGTFISVPSAVLATLCLVLDLPPAIAVAAVVLPRVLPHAYEQIRAAMAKPHVLIARARGLAGSRVFFFHVVPSALAPVLAVAGVSVTLALSASIPIEALADSPGLGQLAWRAALGRDLPVLVTVTLLLTAVTVAANTVADLLTMRARRTP